MHSLSLINTKLAVLIILATALLIVFQVIIYRRIQFTLRAILRDQHSNYREIESLFSIFSTLKIRAPLPSMREWAVSPDFASTIISQILENKPKVILELGSGVSTLISAYCVQQIGEGKIISIDHEVEYATKTLKALSTHGLRELVDVRSAPLSNINLENKDWPWYSMNAFDGIQGVDLLVIDGPPASYGSMARYPALPLIANLLSDNAVILVDDANRDSESEMVRQWLKRFINFQLEYSDNEKGVFILKKIPSIAKVGIVAGAIEVS